MAASFSWNQGTGASGTTDLGASGQLFNFMSTDGTSNSSNFTANPVTAGNRSYDVWLRGHFTGSYNSISNAKFWNWTPVNSTYFTVAGTTQSSYNQSSTATTYAGTTAVPTSSSSTSAPGSPLVPATTGLTGSANSYSGWVALQLSTATNSPAGNMGTTGFTFQYDEN